MFDVKIVCVGSAKEHYWEAACAEYRKRLTGRCRLNIMELAEERLPGAPSPAEITAGLNAEAARVLPFLEERAFSVAMCVEGRSLSSEQLAQKLAAVMLEGKSSAVFVIGGSYGLAPTVKEKASLRLSMSPMTFPHGLARVMLCEQLYRAFSINAGAKYHK